MDLSKLDEQSWITRLRHPGLGTLAIADVLCVFYKTKVGHDLPFGPKGRHFVAFGSDAAKMFGVCHGRKALWMHLRHQDQIHGH